MKYIYDIILNYNDNLYDFFEWNTDDSIDYIKRIPIFKVSNNVINDLINNKVMISKEFIDSIKNKTEVYMDNGIGIIEYTSLFCSNDKVIAIEFNYKGILIFKSDLLIDEALDIIECCNKVKTIKLDYKIITETKINLMTREEIKMIDFVKRELNNIEDIDKIKYLYYECFNKVENNIIKMNIELEKYMYKNPSKLFNILMLSYSKH